MGRITPKRVVIVVLALCFGCGIAWGQDPVLPVGDPAWVARGAGNGDGLRAEFGWRPGWSEDRTEIGIYGSWLDGVLDEQVESWGAGIYASYDVIHEAPFRIPGLGVEVPSTMYIGTSLGAIKPAECHWDATATLFTGLSFGDESIRLGVRGEYILSSALWTELADVPDDARVLLTVEYRLGR
jgi:hypothetical protein